MRKTMEKMKEKKAITLIALVVTIAVILILAGITVGMVTSDNGVLKETKNAKPLAEIDNEKSIVERAKMLTMMRSKNGSITYDVFEPALKEEAGKMPTEVSDAIGTIEVLFTNSNRYYEIDEDGNVSEPQEVVKEKYAGDITKGGKCDGSVEKPYEINCIEDLVVLSIMTNGGNTELNISKNTMSGKNIILMRTLNFNSKFSYNDSTTTKFGDLNQDGTIEDIRTELTKTEENCVGFTPIGEYAGNKENRFCGVFDGRNNEIKNFYIKTAKDAGCFGGVWNATIKNLTVSGSITSTEKSAGGVVGNGVAYIYNCYNKATIHGKGFTGGIGGNVCAPNATLLIINCINTGEVYSLNDRVGGIVGGSSGEITNCYNAGRVIGEKYDTGGIVGQARWQVKITNSYNSGEIQSLNSRGAGITAFVYAETTVNNCYNIGKIIGNTTNGLGGTTINNSYNFGKMTIKSGGNTIGAKTMNSCYYKSSQKANNETTEDGAIDVEGKTAEQIVELLNSYKDDTGAYPTDWKQWKVGKDGNPTFSD